MDLFELRLRNRKTQWDLRIATGIHQSKISLIERGYVKPSPEEKRIIADALNISVDKINWPEPRC
jgi:transcriptional regulator with XRE-family HTH domain